jgi:hypothetical protein
VAHKLYTYFVDESLLCSYINIMKFLIKLFLVLTFIVVLCMISYSTAFPKKQKKLAFTLATGIGMIDLQSKVNELETKAINKREFSQEEVNFLRNLFLTMSRGARYSLILEESGKLTKHYLDMSGRDYKLPSFLFYDNDKVKKKMEIIKKEFWSDLQNNTVKSRYETKEFYMPDKSVPDSIYALYYGKLFMTPRINESGGEEMTWRAEVPWFWPKYDDLKERFGDYKAHSFTIPNLKSIFGKTENSLRVDDGLGEHLVTLGVAKPFLAYSEWKEVL